MFTCNPFIQSGVVPASIGIAPVDPVVNCCLLFQVVRNRPLTNSVPQQPRVNSQAKVIPPLGFKFSITGHQRVQNNYPLKTRSAAELLTCYYTDGTLSINHARIFTVFQLETQIRYPLGLGGPRSAGRIAPRLFMPLTSYGVGHQYMSGPYIKVAYKTSESRRKAEYPLKKTRSDPEDFV